MRCILMFDCLVSYTYAVVNNFGTGDIRFEDGETNGLSMPDNSLRKTRRCRSINVNGPEIERRKSRRHSCCEQKNSYSVYFTPKLL